MRRAAIWDAADEPFLGRVGLRQLVLAACTGSTGRPFAYVVGGIRRGSGDFHRGLAPEQESFTVFAQQVGALLQNRADQTTILAQIDQLRVEGAAESGPGRWSGGGAVGLGSDLGRGLLLAPLESHARV